MIQVGRICLKIAGRDAGKKAIVVETLDDSNVIIDGEVRRRKCNIKHLEPTSQEIKLKKGASHTDVVKEFKKIGIEVVTTKPRKKKSEKPIKNRITNQKKKLEEKKAKQKAKKEKTSKKITPKTKQEKKK
tara:strand:- start:51 stop:440 length:390 start_codon:yes stop_codon:yes gene_type:complete